MPARETPGLPAEPSPWEKLDQLLFLPPPEGPDDSPITADHSAKAASPTAEDSPETTPAPPRAASAARVPLPSPIERAVRDVRPALAPPAPRAASYSQVSVNLDPEIHLRLREAAIGRGSIRLMSEIVRECIEDELARIEQFDAEGLADYAAELRATNTSRAGWRTVAYQLAPDQRARILPLSGRLALPLGFVVARALARGFADSTPSEG